MLATVNVFPGNGPLMAELDIPRRPGRLMGFAFCPLYLPVARAGQRGIPPFPVVSVSINGDAPIFEGRMILAGYQERLMLHGIQEFDRFAGLSNGEILVGEPLALGSTLRIVQILPSGQKVEGNALSQGQHPTPPFQIIFRYGER